MPAHRCPEVRQALDALLLALRRYGVSSLLVLRDTESLCVAVTGDVVPDAGMPIALDYLASMASPATILEHPDSAVREALVRLCDELCSWERSTSRESVLILKAPRFAFRVFNGKPDVPEDMSDERLLNVFYA